jgi:FkbM family methyltransferase
VSKSYIKNVLGRWGKCYYIKDDEYIGKSIKNYGEYVPDETEWLLHLASTTEGCILDVGANIGCISQALAHEGYDVIAFEPQKAVYEILQLNCPNILSYNVGVGSRNCNMLMPSINYNKRANFGGISCSSTGDVSVPIITLDSLVFPKVGLIKIDVEGFELEVLIGAQDLIKRDRPIIYLEADRQEKIPALTKHLASIGYTWVAHNPPLYREKNYFNKRKNIWPMNYVSLNWECRYSLT